MKVTTISTILASKNATAPEVPTAPAVVATPEVAAAPEVPTAPEVAASNQPSKTEGPSVTAAVVASNQPSKTENPSVTAATPAGRLGLLEKYNPQQMRTLALHPMRCYRGNTPTLQKVAKEYGIGVTVSWLSVQLMDTARLWGSADRIEADVLTATAESILATYPRLNMAEIALFLTRLRGGAYGKVAYGRLTPDHIVGHIPTFIQQRRQEVEAATRTGEREGRFAEQKRWAERAVTHDVAKYLNFLALQRTEGDAEAAIELLKRWNGLRPDLEHLDPNDTIERYIV